MPLFSRKRKDTATSPEIPEQNRPLVYAQSAYARSEVDSEASTSYRKAEIRPRTHKAITTDIFADVTYYKEQQDKKRAIAEAEAAVRKAEGVGDAEKLEQPDIERPKTPPQGSRSIPWESYHELPIDHPVFKYPPEVREKCYAKGVDPVVKALMDKSRLGIEYGEKTNPVKTWYRRGHSVMTGFATANIGAVA